MECRGTWEPHVVVGSWGFLNSDEPFKKKLTKVDLGSREDAHLLVREEVVAVQPGRAAAAAAEELAPARDHALLDFLVPHGVEGREACAASQCWVAGRVPGRLCGRSRLCV